MSEPISLHDHPNFGPVVVVHVRDDAPIGPDNPAHAFGPFRTEAIAMAWETLSPDKCHRFVIDVFDPELNGL